MNPRMTAIAIVIAAAAAGCAHTPPAGEALSEARSAYENAQDNPHVTRFAPRELAAAGMALSHAERTARSEPFGAEAAHQAYLAEQQARIAHEVAMARAADAEVARADEERRRVILNARLRAAERARAQAEAQLKSMQSAARVGGEIGMDLQRLHAEVPGLKASKTGESLILNVDGAALFDGRQGALNADGRRALASIARFMDEHPRQAVMVRGFEAGQADVVRQTLAQYAKRRVDLQFPEPATAGASAGR